MIFIMGIIIDSNISDHYLYVKKVVANYNELQNHQKVGVSFYNRNNPINTSNNISASN